MFDDLSNGLFRHYRIQSLAQSVKIIVSTDYVSYFWRWHPRDNCLENRTSTSLHNHSRRCERVCSSSKVLVGAMTDNSSVKVDGDEGWVAGSLNVRGLVRWDMM